MKPKTTQSEPPAPAGGLTEVAADDASQTDTSSAAPQETPEGVTLTALQTENADLKAAIRLRDARDAVTAELEKAGARSPELLWDALLDRLEFDGEGRPQNVAAIVAEFKVKYPEQFGTHVSGSIDGGAGQTATPRLTREALRRMKPSEIAELDWAEVRRVLSS